MEHFYLFRSRILTHILFWVVYYISFSFIWANEGNYYASFYLEFVLLPTRILAVYFTIYILLPKYLLKEKYWQFGVYYLSLLLVCGLLQRTFIHFFYEPWFMSDPNPLFDLNSVFRAMILINSTVLFVSAFKIIQLWQFERSKNLTLEAASSSADKMDEPVEIRSDKRTYRVAGNDILFIEGLGNYVIYHTLDKQLISYTSLNQVLRELPPSFIRIHKSYVINKNHVKSYDSENVEIKEKFLPVGRAYKTDFIELK